ncbi:MAG: adenosine kinase [Bacteroides sp.]|nr:adenosine kinase [Bacteroides sp.]
MDKILGLGNALVDVLARLEDDTLLEQMKLPKGSMQLIDEEKLQEINRCFSTMKTYMATGGSAGNTILTLANLGAPAGFIGKIGQDHYGEFYKKCFADKGIEEKLQLSPFLPSGVASTFISPDGERTFGTFLGAASSLKAEDLTLELFQGYSYFYVEGYLVQDHDMILRAIELAKEAGLQICLDMASYNIVKEDLAFFNMLIRKYVDILFANEEEAKAFTGEEPEKALETLSEMCSIAIVKIGSRGSLVKKGTTQLEVAATQVKEVLDTTGAGDYYSAGFLYGLTHGYNLEKCAKIGTLLSGYVIQVVGTTLSKDKWDEIKLNINTIIAQ